MNRVKELEKIGLFWNSESWMQNELRKRIKEWKQGQSKDGYIIRAEGVFKYKDIKYLIKVLRYFDHTNLFKPIGSQRISDCHAVAEFPEETRPLVNLVTQIDEYSEFLYHDTLHIWNDNQTIEQQIEEMHKIVKYDIDSIPKIIKQKEEEIANLKKEINKILNKKRINTH